MATKLVGDRLLVQLAGAATPDPLLAGAKKQIDYGKRFLKRLGSGTGSGQGNVACIKEVTIAGGGSDSHDLAGGITDFEGAVRTFTKVKRLLFLPLSTNAAVIIVGNGTNPFIGPFGAAGASLVHVLPGEIFLIGAHGAGWDVTAGTGDILKVAGTAGEKYLMGIWGVA